MVGRYHPRRHGCLPPAISIAGLGIALATVHVALVLLGRPTTTERRLVARAMTAAPEARRAATHGEDAVALMAAIRPHIGERPRRSAFGYTWGVLTTVS